MWSKYFLALLLLLAILNCVDCAGGRERRRERAWKKHVQSTDHYEEPSGADFEDLVEPEQSETESEHASDDEAEIGLEGGEDEPEWEGGNDPVDPLLESPRNKGIAIESDPDTPRKVLIECITLLNTESGDLASFVGRWRNGYPDQENERFRNKCLQKVRDGQAPRIDEQQKRDLDLFEPHPKSKAAQHAPKEKPKDKDDGEGGTSDPKEQADIIDREGKKQDREFVKNGIDGFIKTLATIARAHSICLHKDTMKSPRVLGKECAKLTRLVGQFLDAASNGQIQLENISSPVGSPYGSPRDRGGWSPRNSPGRGKGKRG